MIDSLFLDKVLLCQLMYQNLSWSHQRLSAGIGSGISKLIIDVWIADMIDSMKTAHIIDKLSRIIPDSLGMALCLC